MMYRIAMIVLIAFIMSVPAAFAAPSQTISYQGYLKDTKGVPVNGNIGIAFYLYDVPAGGLALWGEEQAVTIANGLYSVQLGSNIPLDTRVFDVQPLYLGVRVGSDEEMAPRQLLSLVPFAFRALVADAVNSQSTMVSNVPTGIAPLQVQSQTQVNNLNADMVDGLHGSNLVLKNGDAMTGPLSVESSHGAANTSLFMQTNPAGSGDAVQASAGGSGSAVNAYANGTGRAGFFRIMRSDSSSPTIEVTSNGLGNVGLFQNLNPANSAPTLYAATLGSGPAAQFSGNVVASGSVNAASFAGSGAGLTNLAETDPTVNSLAKAALSCSVGQIAVATASGWQCGRMCAYGTTDCNNSMNDGCEVNMAADVNNCGGCGLFCSGNNVPARTCSNGICSGTCSAGFADCNNNRQSDGCEVNISTNANSCGGCNFVCSNYNMSTRSCGGGVCNGTCSAGFADCNNNKQADGCEVSISTNVNNCGGCNFVCSNNNMLTRSCGGGACNGTCNAGFADCNFNKLADGCETNTSNDRNNCGGCGVVCSVLQSCVNSTCL